MPNFNVLGRFLVRPGASFWLPELPEPPEALGAPLEALGALNSPDLTFLIRNQKMARAPNILDVHLKKQTLTKVPEMTPGPCSLDPSRLAVSGDVVDTSRSFLATHLKSIL